MSERETADRKAESVREHHPLVAVIAKKHRAARKKLTKVEETEKKIASQKIKALPEQLEAIKNKTKLSILVEDYEETLEQLVVAEKEVEKARLESLSALEAQFEERLQNEKLLWEKDLLERYEVVRQEEFKSIARLYRLSDYFNPQVSVSEEYVEEIKAKVPNAKYATAEEFQTIVNNMNILRGSVSAFDDPHYTESVSLSLGAERLRKFVDRSTDLLTDELDFSTVAQQVEDLESILEAFRTANTTVPEEEEVIEVAENAESVEVQDEQAVVGEQSEKLKPSFKFLHPSFLEEKQEEEQQEAVEGIEQAQEESQPEVVEVETEIEAEAPVQSDSTQPEDDAQAAVVATTGSPAESENTVETPQTAITEATTVAEVPAQTPVPAPVAAASSPVSSAPEHIPASSEQQRRKGTRSGKHERSSKTSPSTTIVSTNLVSIANGVQVLVKTKVDASSTPAPTTGYAAALLSKPADSQPRNAQVRVQRVPATGLAVKTESAEEAAAESEATSKKTPKSGEGEKEKKSGEYDKNRQRPSGRTGERGYSGRPRTHQGDDQTKPRKQADADGWTKA